MMGKWVAKAAAVVALSLAGATGANAQTVSSGYVEGSIGYSDVSVGAASTDGASFSVGGAYAAPITSNIGFQIDGEVTYLDLDPQETTVLEGQGHVYWRDSERGAFGAFVSVINDSDVLDDTLIGGGVEGELYLGDWTVGGEIAYYEGDDTNVELTGFAADVTYYYTENISVEAGAGYGNLDIGAVDSDYYTLRLQGEYGFDRWPASVTASVSYNDYDDFNTDATQVRIGFNWRFGSRTVMERDRYGASRDGGNRVLGILD